ncbi:hypothetical protein CMO95_01200 [Candidatus Woesearchaeota archaeon]|jgi:hypothetical protein|nr:hypothetical protein [Candidatus Woesearchaeota archaeon]|tara:strand:- start:129 stop:686 length:558 start_codon:yes stop_codon:yes gene_type:complete
MALCSEISNRNYLSPIGFKLTIDKAPKSVYFSNQANIPSIDVGVSVQSNYLRDIPIPGDKMEFEDFTFQFMVDENLENYRELQRWMRGISYPESLSEIYNWQISETNKNPDRVRDLERHLVSDGSLIVLTSNNTNNFQIKFTDLWPYSLSTLNFDATESDYNYMSATVRFKYTMYNIIDINGNPL